MENLIEKLKWDSNFFNFNVGKVIISNNTDLSNILSEFKKSSFKLLYLFSSNKVSDHNLFTQFDAALVDIKTTFLKEVNKNIKPQSLIKEYKNSKISNELYNLAVQSGVYSRFRIDSRINQVKFEELYKLWVEKIVSKQNNELVFVNETNNKVCGFLALGEKNKRADLIMGSVDQSVRGKGIGLQLFLEAERVANMRGFKKIQIVTQGMNKPACNLYKKIGYQISKIEYVYHVWKKDSHDI